MPPQHKAPETDKYAIPSKIGTNCDDAGEEQNDANVLFTPERVIRIMKDQSEWMFHVAEEEKT
eukprot:12292822-Ditylum_brightwellii.AAC.1